MYVSTNERVESKAVTGLIFVPPTHRTSRRVPGGDLGATAPTGWRTSARRRSTPPMRCRGGDPDQLLGEGWEVTASDYQGEGTPRGSALHRGR